MTTTHLPETLVQVEAERYRQEQKVQRGEIPWNCSDPNILGLAKLAVLGEEFGEVSRALVDGEPLADLRTELIQVAAVAVAWAESL